MLVPYFCLSEKCYNIPILLGKMKLSFPHFPVNCLWMYVSTLSAVWYMPLRWSSYCAVHSLYSCMWWSYLEELSLVSKPSGSTALLQVWEGWVQWHDLAWSLPRVERMARTPSRQLIQLGHSTPLCHFSEKPCVSVPPCASQLSLLAECLSLSVLPGEILIIMKGSYETMSTFGRFLWLPCVIFQEHPSWVAVFIPCGTLCPHQ